MPPASHKNAGHSNNHRALIKKLLGKFYCPVALEHVHPALAVIGPDTHLYERNSAKNIAEGNKWRSPLTRDEFDCPNTACLRPVPHAMVQMYDEIANSHPDVIKELSFKTEFKIRNGVVVSYEGDSKDIVIPHGVTSIGEGAFSEYEIRSVSIPDSVTSIGPRAFDGNFLTSVIIPNSVETIGEYAFQYNDISMVTFPASSLKSIGGWAFSTNKLHSVSIPNTIEEINEGSFANNMLETVNIPNSVKRIGKMAFMMNALKKVKIPNSVKTIEEGAFQVNNQLKQVSISSSTDIHNHSFPPHVNIKRNK